GQRLRAPVPLRRGPGPARDGVAGGCTRRRAVLSAADAFVALVRGVARRPAAVLVGVLAVTAAGVVLALGLRPTAATDTLVNRSDPAYRATARYHRLFGDDSVIV